jgi:hypothetical protein
MADWFFAKGTAQRGPVALEFIFDSLRAGTLTAHDMVWRDGMAQWTPTGQVPELAGAFSSATPAIPPAQPAAFATSAAAARMAPGFGQSYYSQTPPQHSALAITSMVLGIVGMCGFCVSTGIPALICGIIALNAMKRTGDVRGRGMAIAGVVLGSISIVIAIGYVLLFVAIAGGAATHRVNFSQPQPPHAWPSNP